MTIDLTKVKNFDLSYVEEFFPEKYLKHKINEIKLGIENGEHYKLLAYLSSLFDKELILDLGTRDGLSALVLSRNLKNNIISYDILPKNEAISKFEKSIPNCIFKQKNIFDEDLNIIKKAKLIFLDLDPHDGIQEKKFFEILEKINYKGIIIIDDISTTKFFIDFPEMRNFWNNIKQKKYDISEFGHGSGTGLVDFSEQVNLLKE